MIWRPAERSDIAALADFFAVVERTWPASRDLGVAAMRARLDRVAEPSDILLTLDSAGEIIGYADVIDIEAIDDVHRIALTIVPAPRMSPAARREQLDRLIGTAHDVHNRRPPVGSPVLGVRLAAADRIGQELLAELGFSVVSELRTLRRDLDAPVPQRPDVLPIVAYSAEFEEATRLLHNAAFHDNLFAGQPTPAQWRQLYVGVRGFMPDLSFLALDGNSVAGLLFTWAADVEHPRQLRIPVIATAPDRRRRGIASSLIQRALEQYRAAGYASVVLDVEAANEPAVILYTRMGFVDNESGFSFYSRPL